MSEILTIFECCQSKQDDNSGTETGNVQEAAARRVTVPPTAHGQRAPLSSALVSSRSHLNLLCSAAGAQAPAPALPAVGAARSD